MSTSLQEQLVLNSIKDLNPNDQIETLKETIRTLCRESLFFTCKYLLGYEEVNENTHGNIIRALESSSPRKLLVCPRGAFKSSIGVVAFSIWILIRNPSSRIMIDSEAYTNSKNFLREIKSHLTNPFLTDLFGEFKSDDNWTEGSITIRQRTKPYKESSITCSGIGAVKVGQHYDFIIMDDLSSNKNCNTKETRQKTIDHYKLNTSILEPSGTMAVIGTRYHAEDLIGYIIENEIEDNQE